MAGRRASLALGLATFLVSSSTLALGTSLTWNGSSNNWFTAGNWTPSSAPTFSDQITINSAGVNTATISSAGAAAQTVNIGSSAGSNGALVVTGAGALSVVWRRRDR